MGVLVRVILPNKSGFAFCKSVKTKKLVIYITGIIGKNGGFDNCQAHFQSIFGKKPKDMFPDIRNTSVKCLTYLFSVPYFCKFITFLNIKEN